MGIGASIFLLAVGAILAFAVHTTVAGIDIHVIGWILMAAGLIGLLMNLFIFAPRKRRTVIESQRTAAPVVAAEPVAPTVVAQQPVVDQNYSARHEIREENV
jgi:hypothetical protein